MANARCEKAVVIDGFFVDATKDRSLRQLLPLECNPPVGAVAGCDLLFCAINEH